MAASAAGAGIGPGSRLGSYVIDGVIGRGAMGLVYRGRHMELDRPVAVKVLQSLAPDPEAGARFRREAQAIARLRHPNILTLHDYGEVGDTPYMIIEYLPGGSLADRLGSRRRPGRQESLRILDELAAALDHAHAHGIVHRDVKPANALIAGDGSAVLTDFGLARLLESSARTATGISVGTPFYMAPEQVTRAEVGEAADRYALATVAYELLTGVLPFDGDEVMRVLYAKVHSDPAPPSSRNPDLPPSVDAVLGRGLSRDAGARWPTCQEMTRALRMALTHVAPTMVLPRRPAAVPEPVVDTVPVAVADLAAVAVPAPVAVVDTGPVAVPPAVAGAVPVAAAPAADPPRRRRWRQVAALALVALIVLVGAAILRSRQQMSGLSLPSVTVQPGGLVDYSAYGLQPDLRIRFLVGGRQVGAYSVGPDGRLQASFRIPAAQRPGRYVVRACWNGSCPIQSSLVVARAPA